MLLQWIKELSPAESERRYKNLKPHVRCSQDEKIQAVLESCKGNLKISQILEIYNVTLSSISTWRKEMLGEGRTLKMSSPSNEDKSIEQLMHEKT